MLSIVTVDGVEDVVSGVAGVESSRVALMVVDGLDCTWCCWDWCCFTDVVTGGGSGFGVTRESL